MTERALLEALQVATAAGNVDAITAIVGELRARRLERSDVVDLVEARDRRRGPSQR